MQITAQSAFYQCGSANDPAAAHISFGHEMHVAASSNCPAETAADFVIAQINMGAASRTDCRRRRVASLLVPFALETLDHPTPLSLPKVLMFMTDRGIICGRRLFFCV